MADRTVNGKCRAGGPVWETRSRPRVPQAQASTLLQARERSIPRLTLLNRRHGAPGRADVVNPPPPGSRRHSPAESNFLSVVHGETRPSIAADGRTRYLADAAGPRADADMAFRDDQGTGGKRLTSRDADRLRFEATMERRVGPVAGSRHSWFGVGTANRRSPNPAGPRGLNRSFEMDRERANTPNMRPCCPISVDS